MKVAEFRKHSVASRDSEDLVAERFYKKENHPQAVYAKLLTEYEAWISSFQSKIFEATKAANWFAEVVRKEINPSFFAKEGKFLVSHGPYIPDFSFRTELLQFTPEDKKQYPQKLYDELEAIQAKKDRWLDELEPL